MKYKIYFHVGYPKTATSFLQDYIFTQLKNVNYIPTSHIVESLLKIIVQDEFNFNYETIREDIQKKLIPNKSNIISFESLCGEFRFKNINQKLIADRLCKLFPESYIIFTIRNQYDLIESLYKQEIHQGGTKKFTEFINYKNGKLLPSYSPIDGRINLEMINYVPIINYYADIFGSSHIKIILFEIIKAKGISSFIKEIVSFLGTNEPIIIPHKITNESFQSHQIKIARFLNRLFRKDKYIENGLIPEINIPILGKLNTSLVRKLLQSPLSFKILGHKPITNQIIKTQVKEYYKNTNKDLDKKYNLSLNTLYKNYYF